MEEQGQDLTRLPAILLSVLLCSVLALVLRIHSRRTMGKGGGDKAPPCTPSWQGDDRWPYSPACLLPLSGRSGAPCPLTWRGPTCRRPRTWPPPSHRGRCTTRHSTGWTCLRGASPPSLHHQLTALPPQPPHTLPIPLGPSPPPPLIHPILLGPPAPPPPTLPPPLDPLPPSPPTPPLPLDPPPAPPAPRPWACTDRDAPPLCCCLGPTYRPGGH